MSIASRWKKALTVALAAGIVCFSAYGVYNTANAYTGITQSQITGDNPVFQSLPADGPVPGGTACSPLGCAACGGCANSLYLENVSTISPVIPLERTD